MGTFMSRKLTNLALVQFFLVLCLFGTFASAHEDEGHSHKFPDAIQHRPSPVPDRIVLSWVANPATSQTVTWRTDASIWHAVGELAEAEDGPNFESKAKSVRAMTTALDTDLGVVSHYHSVDFDDLKPETKYVYRVGDGHNWSEWSHFDTASSEAKPFSFVYFGDAQNDIKSHWSRVVREAYRDAPKASFLLHAGDLINRANRDAEWGEWFHASGFIHRRTPCIATPGNHEYDDGRLSHHWRPTFAFPKHGPDGLEETAYWLDYQCARLVSLNSNEKQREQVAWLRDVLSQNDKPWTILTFHHPMYSSARGRDNVELRNLWQPVFDEFKVDLVLQGHDHTYARTGLMKHQNVDTGVSFHSQDSGTMYVVSVSGPKMYKLGRRPFMQRAAQDTQLYQIIRVRRKELRYEARTATGKLYDAFTLRKRDGQGNQLVEQIPDTAELTGDG
jgi:3',5'-cyclic AMP phosphodiesterase CpdA